MLLAFSTNNMWTTDGLIDDLSKTIVEFAITDPELRRKERIKWSVFIKDFFVFITNFAGKWSLLFYPWIEYEINGI